MTLTVSLTQLESSGLIRLAQMVPELEYLFRHALIQDAAYESILKADRRVLHRVVGETLEQLYPHRLDDLAPLLGQHFTEAGQTDKAIKYWLRAGDLARQVFAQPEAVDAYQRALTLLNQQGNLEQAARTLMKLGLTYHTAFDFRRAREAYESGFALWQHAMKTAPDPDVPPAPHPLRLDTFLPDTLDPTLAALAPGTRVIQQLFSGLVEQSFDLEVVPAVAHAWEISEDGRRYLFYLRQDARWSDGVPVTAGDFEYAWKRTLAPSTHSPIASGFFDIQNAEVFNSGALLDAAEVGVRALDDRTLEVVLKEPRGHFLQLLASWGWPVPRHRVEPHPNDWATPSQLVSNGPFKLESWESGQPLVLTRNPAYIGRFNGNIQQVALSFNETGAPRLYEGNQCDIALHIHLKWPTVEREQARRRHPEEYMFSPALWVFYLAFDTRQPPFHDTRVRRAFALAIDREKLASEALNGEVLPATGGLVPPNMPGHSPAIALPYAPDQARQALAEAGYPAGEGFPAVFTFVPGRSGFPWKILDHLRAQWQANLGIELTLEDRPDTNYFRQLREAPPSLFITGYVLDYPDPDSILQPSGSEPLLGWHNLAYDQLLEEARRMTDAGARLKAYQQADQMLIEAVGVVPLVYQWHHALVKPWVKKFFVLPTTAYLLRDVILEPHA